MNRGEEPKFILHNLPAIKTDYTKMKAMPGKVIVKPLHELSNKKVSLEKLGMVLKEKRKPNDFVATIGEVLDVGEFVCWKACMKCKDPSIYNDKRLKIGQKIIYFRKFFNENEVDGEIYDIFWQHEI